MAKSKRKENIEWLIEQYQKLKPKPYSTALIVGGLSIIVGPGWWQDIVTKVTENIYSEFVNETYVSSSNMNLWVGLLLIFIGLVWYLLLRLLDKKSKPIESENVVSKLLDEQEAKEKEKWKPVIAQLIFDIERIEGWFYVGFKNLSMPSQENFGLAAHSHKMIKRYIQQIAKTVATLRSQDAPEFMDVESTIDTLFAKFEFIVTVYQEHCIETDYVLPTPVKELGDLTEKLMDLANRHSYSIKTEGTDPNLRESTLKAWEVFCNTNPVFDMPTLYTASKSRKLRVLDTKTMQEVKGLEVGMQVHCFMTN